MKPEVSIITPVYNLEQYIEETAHSILAQTITDWEWIIVDDDSTDNTISLIQKMDDPRIKILHSQHFGYPSVLRNLGAKAAKAEYLAFVDGDDLLMPEKLESQLKLMKANHLKWSFTAANNYFETTGKVEKRRIRFELPTIITPEQSLETLLQVNYICNSSVIMRKKDFIEIGGYQENFRFHEDKNLWLRAAAHGWNLGFCQEILLQYRIHPNSLYQSKKLQYLYFNFTAYANFKEHFPLQARKYRSIIRRYYADNYKNIFALKFVTAQQGCFKDLARAIGLNPLAKGYWNLLFQHIFFKEKLRQRLKEQLG